MVVRWRSLLSICEIVIFYLRQSSEPPGEDGRGGWRRRVADPAKEQEVHNVHNMQNKGGRQEHGGRREIEEVRFRNVRSGEGGPAIVGTGSEEVRFRNVKMRQKRPRPSAGRPKSEVSFSQEYLQKSQHCTRREVFLGEPFRNRVPIQNFSLVPGSLARILILNP